MEDDIIKKINYAIIKFTDNEGIEHVLYVYGKSNINKTIKNIVDEFSLVSNANIDVKIITERRSISLSSFLSHSVVIENS